MGEDQGGLGVPQPYIPGSSPLPGPLPSHPLTICWQYRALQLTASPGGCRTSNDHTRREWLSRTFLPLTTNYVYALGDGTEMESTHGSMSYRWSSLLSGTAGRLSTSH